MTAFISKTWQISRTRDLNPELINRVHKNYLESYQVKNRATHKAFVDLTKANDPIQIKDWQVIENYNHIIAIKIGKMLIASFKIFKGLVRICSSSPTLYKIYLEDLMKTWKRNEDKNPKHTSIQISKA